MEGFVKIQNSESLVRDLSSGAVINTDRVGYENYMAKRKAEQTLQEKIKNNSDKIEKIESDLTEIKQLLVSLINKDK